MLDLTRSIRHRETKEEARVLATDLPGENPICIAYCGKYRGKWYSSTMSKGQAEGLYENLPRKMSGWVNAYGKGVAYPRLGHMHPTKGEADGDVGGDRVACIFVDFTEGDGL